MEIQNASTLLKQIRDIRMRGRRGLTVLHCNECERNFTRRLVAFVVEIRCPKCGSGDTEPINY